MSRYRNIHCLIWNDDKFPFCSDDCKLVFLHVLTTPMSTGFGLYKASLGALSDEMRWDVKRYMKAFQEGLSKGYFLYDERFYVLYLPNFLKYNQPHNPNVLRSWANTFNETPNCALKDQFYQQLKSFIESFPESFKKVFDVSFFKNMPLVMDTDTDLVSFKEESLRETKKPKKIPPSVDYPKEIETILQAFLLSRKSVENLLVLTASKNKTNIMADSRRLAVFIELKDILTATGDETIFQSAINEIISKDVDNLNYLRKVIESKKQRGTIFTTPPVQIPKKDTDTIDKIKQAKIDKEAEERMLEQNG